MSFGQRKLDRSKPEVDFPQDPVPTELRIVDEIQGAGKEATPGATVS